MPDFPKLLFLPVSKLLDHKQIDLQRSHALIQRLRASGVFQTPPVVAPFHDGTGRYLVLDGASRTQALRELGIRHALVQVMAANDSGLSLQTWNHIVWELDAQRFLKIFRKIPGFQVELDDQENNTPGLEGDNVLVKTQSCSGHYYNLRPQTGELARRVELLNNIVDSYQAHARIERTRTADLQPYIHIFPSLGGLVIFPKFSIESLLRLAGQGLLLPGGIIRVTISPRALHLNYPLEELSSDKPVEEKNALLQNWLGDRIQQKGVRYYAESTYLFDE